MVTKPESADLPGDSLAKWSDADQELLYQHLKQMAAAKLRTMSPGKTLSPTVLVNEAYIKLSRARWRSETDIWNCPRLFFSAAADAMRQIVIDYYRHRSCEKRGGSVVRVDIDVDLLPGRSQSFDVLAVNEAIEQFALAHPAKAELVKLRYFLGMTMPECAMALDMSVPTAERHWRYARAWLADWLS